MPLEPIPNQDQPAASDLANLEIMEPLCAVFRRALKEEGLKYTPERAHILDTIIRLDGLFEADALLDEMRSGGFRVSKATVYRTLKLLEDAGIIQRVLFDRDQSHYQLAYGTKADALIVRVDDGSVEAVELPELVEIAARLCEERSLKPEGFRLQIFATKG